MTFSHVFLFGGDGGIRTLDLTDANRTLSRTMRMTGPEGKKTDILLFKSHQVISDTEEIRRVISEFASSKSLTTILRD